MTQYKMMLKSLSFFFPPISNFFWQNIVVFLFQMQSAFFSCYLHIISLAL